MADAFYESATERARNILKRSRDFQARATTRFWSWLSCGKEMATVKFYWMPCFKAKNDGTGFSGTELEGYLARKKRPPPLGPPQGPVQSPTVGS